MDKHLVQSNSPYFHMIKHLLTNSPTIIICQQNLAPFGIKPQTNVYRSLALQLFKTLTSELYLRLMNFMHKVKIKVCFPAFRLFFKLWVTVFITVIPLAAQNFGSHQSHIPGLGYVQLMSHIKTWHFLEQEDADYQISALCQPVKKC